MRLHLVLPAATVLFLSSAHSALIYQTQNYSNVAGSSSASGLSLLWNKFDTGLGSLTGVTMQFTGNLTGTFTVNNNDATPTDVYNSQGRFRMNFSVGAGAPANIIGAPVTPLDSTPGTGANPGTTVDAGSSQVFAINGPINLYTSGLVDYFANASYFSSAGPATFSTILFRNVTATVDGEDYQFLSSAAIMDGTIELTYTYTPSEAIPEPGTWAAAALLVGGAALLRWRKRAAKVS